MKNLFWAKFWHYFGDMAACGSFAVDKANHIILCVLTVGHHGEHVSREGYRWSWSTPCLDQCSSHLTVGEHFVWCERPKDDHFVHEAPGEITWTDKADTIRVIKASNAYMALLEKEN